MNRTMDEFGTERHTENPFKTQVPAQDGGDPNESKDNLLHQNTTGYTEYNPLASPPDVQKAIKHGQATRVGRIDMAKAKESEMEYCEDCGLPANSEILPICGSRLDLAELGPGFPLYYEYILFCGILLTLLFGIVGVYNIIMNIKGDICKTYESSTQYACSGGFIILLSLGNRSPLDDFKISNILNIAFIGVGLLICYYYRRIQSMTAEEVNRGSITPADYTIIVKGIPTSENNQNIKEFFETKGRPNVKTCVKKVVMAYEIGPYVDMVRKKAKLMAKRGKPNAPENLEAEITDIEAKLKTFEDAITNNSSHKFTGIAFVTFNSEKEARGVILKFKMSGFARAVYSAFSSLFSCLGIKFERTYNGKIINLDRAPEPFDVFWENLGYDWWTIAQKRLLTLLSSFVLIGISFGMILGIGFLQEDIKKNSQKGGVTITILSIVSSYLITIINSLIGFFMRKLAGFEKHTTYTYYFISIATKLSYAQFVNTALITFFVLLVRRDPIILWVQESITSKVFFLFLLNSFVPSLSYFGNPFYLLRVYKRSKIISDGKNSKLTQQEANLAFEGPAVDIAQRYANVQKTMLFTGFYASLLPIGIPLSIISLFLTYWTDKYMLLRRHCRPSALGKQLAEEMADFLELFIVAFACGNIAFQKIIKDEVALLNWIGLGVSILAVILPHNFISKCIQVSDDVVSNTKEYNEVKFVFATEYDRANPITQEEAMREWFIEMAKMAGGSDEKDENGNPLNPQNQSLSSYFQHIPKQNTFNTLANYAQVNPSFHQVHQMQSNTNFVQFRPQNQFMTMPNQFMNRPNQFMNRPNQIIQFGNMPAGMQQPMNMMNQQLNMMMNNMQQMGNKMMMANPFQPRGQPNVFVIQGPKPAVSSHLPTQNNMQTVIQINAPKPQVSSHLPQQTGPNMIMDLEATVNDFMRSAIKETQSMQTQMQAQMMQQQTMQPQMNQSVMKPSPMMGGPNPTQMMQMGNKMAEESMNQTNQMMQVGHKMMEESMNQANQMMQMGQTMMNDSMNQTNQMMNSIMQPQKILISPQQTNQPMGQSRMMDSQFKGFMGQPSMQTNQFRTGENQFKVGENPFKTGENPYKKADNPFTTGENPFKTGENPFMTGENPFKTGENRFKKGENSSITVQSNYDRSKNMGGHMGQSGFQMSMGMQNGMPGMQNEMPGQMLGQMSGQMPGFQNNFAEDFMKMGENMTKGFGDFGSFGKQFGNNGRFM